jgi:hypothetical protein
VIHFKPFSGLMAIRGARRDPLKSLFGSYGDPGVLLQSEGVLSERCPPALIPFNSPLNTKHLSSALLQDAEHLIGR